MTTATVLVHDGAHGAWCWQPNLPNAIAQTAAA